MQDVPGELKERGTIRIGKGSGPSIAEGVSKRNRKKKQEHLLRNQSEGFLQPLNKRGRERAEEEAVSEKVDAAGKTREERKETNVIRLLILNSPSPSSTQ